MNDVVISAEGLGKAYTIGHASKERMPTLRDALAKSAARFGRSVRDMAKGRAIYAGDEIETFWALKDVNFEVKRGDVVGIIGRNGAGKSTLLKILSRITDPTEGRVTIKGRVASLLEVGTGFHPELSGRENIYLNGAILGMTRAEIRARFDEIVDFAGVEKFLDTPVKRYSSGMYVRLAFSVAAHLEPEILIVDEVLAVGDAEFQRKCLGKMQNVAGSGRTVLFVSHNLASVEILCTHGMYLRDGGVKISGALSETIESYRKSFVEKYRHSFSQHKPGGSGKPYVSNFEISSKSEITDVISPGAESNIRIYIRDAQPGTWCSVKIFNDTNINILSFNSKKMLNIFSSVGDQCVELNIPSLPIMPGNYSIVLVLMVENERIERFNPVATFQVTDGSVGDLSMVHRSGGPVIFTEHAWQFRC